MRESRAAFGWLILAIACFVALMFLVTALCMRARAHDSHHAQLNDWLKDLKSANDLLCCNGNDTDAIEDWEAKGSNYRVKFRGEWFDVPQGAIVSGPNRAGIPLLWMNKGYSGVSVRCFMPGTLI